MRTHKKITKTSDVPVPNKYIHALSGEFCRHAFDEERVLKNKGQWRRDVFMTHSDHPLDLEIGTGNGYHFAHRALLHPERSLIGLEIKYKPLVQSIRRALNQGSSNCKMARFHANELEQIFEVAELNDVFIHFPDPWPKKRHFKNRLIQDSFLKTLFELQRPNSSVEFKTDSYSYFEWAMERFEKSAYEILFVTEDLHASETVDHSFMTHFEKIFVNKGIPINYVLLRRP